VLHNSLTSFFPLLKVCLIQPILQQVVTIIGNYLLVVRQINLLEANLALVGLSDYLAELNT
jgi:hypothetical protein